MFRHTNPWQNFLAVFALSDLRSDYVSSSIDELDHEVVNDEVLIATISARFHDKLGSLGIEITSSQSLVHLCGCVDTRQIKARAERIARDTSGVRSVRNRLVVRVAKAEQLTCMPKES
ncbi:hypothetical protein MTBLM1_20422 [Rhodospirillaceae bacterium LM-1]|nr:hypothetical protein MTBLM1_20422 [Rhodospirillaceae bacterium LM-1]